MTDAFPETIPGLLEWRVARAPAAPWLFFEGDSWTLADVASEVDGFAVALAERGVGKGDRVALLLGNRPEGLFTWLAANRLGAIAVPLNHALKAPEVSALLRLARPRVLVAGEHRGLAEAACSAVEEAARPAIAGAAALSGAGRGAPRVDVAPDDVAVLIATSGTTGAPKAVMQTHRTYTMTAESFPAWLGLTGDDRLLAALPLFHINAQAYSTMGALGAGGGLALLPKFSASRFWEDARRLGATQVNVVGAMVHILLATAASKGEREHGLRVCYAALALPQAQHRAFEERFGLAMTVGYGMSETTFGTVWPRGEAPRYGTMGRLRQHPRLGVVNRARVVRDDGSDAAEGEAGELWLANPATMRGYWDDPAQTAAALAGGWLHTGDVVRCDGDGFFTFVSRKKDMIRRRGENIAAAEIENVLLAHPSVGEAAAFGVPSALGEDDIVAYVAPRAGAAIDAEALREWSRARLADFKVPARILVRDALPRTATERVAKHRLQTASPVRRGAASTVAGLFAARVRVHPERVALEDATRRWTYGELDRRAGQLAGVLRANGITRGARVAILSENRAEYLEVFLAAARLGAVVACQSCRLTPPELARCIDLVEPACIVASPRHAATLPGDAAVPLLLLGEDYEARLLAAHAPPPVPDDADPEDALLILYTSGTTGLPKGAVLSHRAEIARNLVLRAEYGLLGDDAFVAWPPLYHMGAAECALGALMSGGSVIVVDGFDRSRLAELVATRELGYLLLMPGMVGAFVAELRARGVRAKGIRVCGVMADLVPAAQIAEVTTLLDAPYANTFGATETGWPPCSSNLIPVGVAPQRLSKTQSPYCEVRLLGPDDVDVPDGSPGELCMRGPTLFSGYWRAPETNEHDFRGGWFHMGDVFVRNPDGSLDFVDRVKYLIKSGGENVYPAEIERVLLQDPRVTDAAVVRRADARWGEVPVAFVARRDESLTAGELRAACRAQLAGYKQPADIVFIPLDAFPRSASGKIQRHELEKRLLPGAPRS